VYRFGAVAPDTERRAGSFGWTQVGELDPARQRSHRDHRRRRSWSGCGGYRRDRTTLLGGTRVATEYRELNLGMILSPDGTPGRHANRHVMCRYPGQGIVGSIYQPEHEPPAHDASEPGRQRRSIAGDQDGHSDRRRVAQEAEERVDRPASVVFLGRNGKALPSVDHEQGALRLGSRCRCDGRRGRMVGPSLNREVG
jgi:hypothetical protein